MSVAVRNAPYVPLSVPKSQVHGSAPSASGLSNARLRMRREGSCTTADTFSQDLLFGISIVTTNGAAAAWSSGRRPV